MSEIPTTEDLPSHLVIDEERRTLRIGLRRSPGELDSGKVEFSSPTFAPAEICTTISVVLLSTILLLSGIILGTALHRPLLYLLVLGAIPGAIHFIRWIYAWVIKPSSISFELGTATISFGRICGRGKQPLLLPIDEIGRVKVEFVQRAAGRGQIVGKFRLSFVAAQHPVLHSTVLEIARISSINSLMENKRIVDRFMANLESLVRILSEAAGTILEQGAAQASCVIEVENFTQFDHLPPSFLRNSARE